jgi:hypothetical protein
MDIFDAVATVECQACRKANFVDLPDSPTDGSIAHCRACGTDLGRWGDMKEAAVRKTAPGRSFTESCRIPVCCIRNYGR